MPGTESSARGVGVCIIVENETVPFDRRVWMEACALRDVGYDVSIICPKRGKYRNSREVLEGIEIYRYWCWNGNGILGYIFEYSWSLLAQFVLALRLYRRRPFRVLHGCNPPEAIFLIARFFKLFGVRFVFDHHDLSPELFLAKFGTQSQKGLFYRLTCAAERFTFQAADFSIATNQSYRDVAITRGGMKPDRVAVVQTCARIAETDSAKRNGGNGQPNGQNGYQGLNGQNGQTGPGGQDGRNRRYSSVVSYVGTIGPQDGVDLLLHSANYIVKEKGREDVRFVIIGSGSELPRLKRMAAKFAFNGNLEFTGRIEHDQVDVRLANSDICVSPDPLNSFNDKCSMIKIFEYMAHAKPIVLFDLKEGRRSAGNGALYARPNDPQDFGEQILKLADSAVLREKLGECGRQRVDETFNWEAQSKKLIETYEKILAE